MLERARKELPRLLALEGDFKPTRPQLRVEIDRDRAADLGVSVATIGRTLETMLGSRKVTTYIQRGEEYDVVLQGRGVAARRAGRPRTTCTCARAARPS